MLSLARCAVSPIWIVLLGLTKAFAMQKSYTLDYTPESNPRLSVLGCLRVVQTKFELLRCALARSVVDLTSVRGRAYSFVMRYSPEHKAQNHEKILSVAARSFRERGGDSSSIGTVMKKVGLKKGGFYRHFKSKDDLFVEAVARALDETGRAMVEVAKSAPEGQAQRAIIERYLSTGHANSPGTGCVRAALGPELARKPVAVRRRIETLLEAYRERFLPFMPGQTREEKQTKIRLLFPSMAGVLMMARVSSNAHKREQILMEARRFFIKCFAEE